ncbi:hypothetical protein AB3S75_028120 [Citrus x aurantiifolia]
MIMEKQSSFRTWTMEKQPSICSVTFEKQPSIQRVMEEQQSFHGVSTNKLPSARGVIEKQQSFHGVTIDKQLSTCDGKTGRKKNKDLPGKRSHLQLHLPARTGNLSRVTEILQGCDSSEAKELLLKQNQEGETPLYVAAESGML